MTVPSLLCIRHRHCEVVLLSISTYEINLELPKRLCHFWATRQFNLHSQATWLYNHPEQINRLERLSPSSCNKPSLDLCSMSNIMQNLQHCDHHNQSTQKNPSSKSFHIADALRRANPVAAFRWPYVPLREVPRVDWVVSGIDLATHTSSMCPRRIRQDLGMPYCMDLVLRLSLVESYADLQRGTPTIIGLWWHLDFLTDGRCRFSDRTW